jgi:hypothetical protein
MQVAGDLVMRSADFPMAEQLAERLEKTLPPELRDQKKGEEGQVPPEVQQHMQQMDQQIQQLGQALEAAATHAEQLEAEQAQKDLNAQMKLQAEQAKRMSLEIELDRTKALGDIKDAQQELMAQGTQQEPQQAHKQPTQSPTVIVDSQGSIAQTLAPMMQDFIGTLAESVNNTGNAVAVLAEGQQAIIQQMASDSAVTQAMLSEVARPKQSQVRIVKQPDGSFVGEKVES